jgi:hypothetical protein
MSLKIVNRDGSTYTTMRLALIQKSTRAEWKRVKKENFLSFLFIKKNKIKCLGVSVAGALNSRQQDTRDSLYTVYNPRKKETNNPGGHLLINNQVEKPFFTWPMLRALFIFLSSSSSSSGFLDW